MNETFRAVWSQWGERYLLEGTGFGGSEQAWYKMCRVRRGAHWTPDRLPPLDRPRVEIQRVPYERVVHRPKIVLTVPVDYGARREHFQARQRARYVSACAAILAER
jgi:hypothetical protein